MSKRTYFIPAFERALDHRQEQISPTAPDACPKCSHAPLVWSNGSYRCVQCQWASEAKVNLRAPRRKEVVREFWSRDKK